MTRQSRLLLSVPAAVLFGLVAWLVRSPREPLYEGKPLTAWLGQLRGFQGDTNDPAFVAFRQMGRPEAVTALVGILQSGTAALPDRWEMTNTVCWALCAMGTNARPAAPLLACLLFCGNAPIPTAQALAQFGSDALPQLLAAVTNRDGTIRYAATRALGIEKSDTDIIVPALIGCLNDDSGLVHHAAVVSLGQLHALPALSVPALLKDFSRQDDLRSLDTVTSLAHFGADARSFVPTLLQMLKDEDESIRQLASSALEKIDPTAAANARKQ